MSASEPVPVSDQELLQGWVERRDEPALRLLFERHRASIRSVARRLLRDADLANDVVQEVFIKLFTHAQTITGSIDGWLRAVAGNQALIHLRSQARRKHRETRVNPGAMVQEKPLTQEAMPLEELVAACVAALSPAERTLIVQIFWEGQTQKDIALQGAVSAVTVHRRARSALENLRRMMAKRGVRVGALAVLLSLTRLAGSEARTGAWALSGTITTGAMAAIVAGVIGLGVIAATMIFSGVADQRAPTPTGPSRQSINILAPSHTPTVLAIPDTPAAPAHTSQEQPPFWLQPVAQGWEHSDPARWLHFAGAEGLWVKPGDPQVEMLNGPGGVEMRYRSSELLIAAMAVSVAPDLGYQIHCEIRTAAGNTFTPWQQRLITALRLTIYDRGDFFLMLRSPINVSARPLVIRPEFLRCEMDVRGRVAALPQEEYPGKLLLDLCLPDLNLSVIPWKSWGGALDLTVYTNIRQANNFLEERDLPSATSFFPVAFAANSDVRHVKFRALTQAERDRLTAQIKNKMPDQTPTTEVSW